MASGQPPSGYDPNQYTTTGTGSPSGMATPPPHPYEQQPPKLSSLTNEEREIMRECERDSFYYSALPLSVCGMLGAQFLVRSGRLRAHPRFGAIPKSIIFGGIGYFAGKIIYLPKCQEKILEKLPNSELAAAIRRARKIPGPEAQTDMLSESGDTSSASSRLKDDYSALEGLDDRFRPSVDRNVKDPDSSVTEEKPKFSYDELRRRNRQDYEDSLAKRPPRSPDAPSYKDSPFMPQKPFPDARDRSSPSVGDPYSSSPPPPPADAPTKKKRTNMWGDPIEE